MIDIIATNNASKIIKMEVILLGVSDYRMVGCVRNTNFQKHHMKVIFACNLRSYNEENMLFDLRNIDWQPLYSDKHARVRTRNVSRIEIARGLLMISQTLRTNEIS